MRSLLEIREKIKLLYSRSEFLLVPVFKFMLAFLAICMVNGELGYMSKLDNLGLVLIVSLLCSFLPNGCIILFGAVFSLMHLYELSLEVAVAGLAIYLIMFLLFFPAGFQGFGDIDFHSAAAGIEDSVCNSGGSGTAGIPYGGDSGGLRYGSVLYADQ